MDYKSQTGHTIDQSFEQYHKDNPEIYRLFIGFALDWLKKGARKISSKQIIGRIRWECEVDTKGEEAKDFKCSDAYTSRYARLFVNDYPEYQERFEFRQLRS
jgi:hypothetical protein